MEGIGWGVVGVFGKNCPEWFIAEHAIYSYSMVLVPIYDRLSEESKQFVVNQSESFSSYFFLLFTLFL